MGKYSSDSDSDKRTRKARRRHRSSSSSSSSSVHSRRRSTVKSNRKRSKSREKYRAKSYRRHRRSPSRDRYRRHKRHSRSPKEGSSKSKRVSSDSSSDNTSSKNKDKSPDCVIVEPKILEELNDDSFVQKPFKSGSSKVPENIIIDLKKQTIKVPEVEAVEPDSIFHHNLFLNEEARMEKWVKELFSFRQKALQQGTTKPSSN